MRHLRLLVDGEPIQLVRVYYAASLAAGTSLAQPARIVGGAHSELRRLGIDVTRFVEEFRGARLPEPEEERRLQLPEGVAVVRSTRTAYAGDRPVEVMDTISNGEVVTFRFDIEL